jgi:hypothetical protein
VRDRLSCPKSCRREEHRQGHPRRGYDRKQGDGVHRSGNRSPLVVVDQQMYPGAEDPRTGDTVDISIWYRFEDDVFRKIDFEPLCLATWNFMVMTIILSCSKIRRFSGISPYSFQRPWPPPEPPPPKLERPIIMPHWAGIPPPKVGATCCGAKATACCAKSALPKFRRAVAKLVGSCQAIGGWYILLLNPPLN